MATSPDAPGPLDTDRRGAAIRIVAIVAAILLVFFLIWFMFLRVEDPGADDVSAPPLPPAAGVPEPEETVSPAKKRGPIETFEVFAPKDPFDPLISAATAGGDGGTTTTGGNGGTTTTGGNGGTTTTTTTTGSGAGGGGAGGRQVGGRRVRVIDVFTGRNGSRAQVQIDGTVYTVDEGELFAENFQLLSASGRCATMLFGDDEFTLCEGEEILK